MWRRIFSWIGLIFRPKYNAVGLFSENENSSCLKSGELHWHINRHSCSWLHTLALCNNTFYMLAYPYIYLHVLYLCTKYESFWWYRCFFKSVLYSSCLHFAQTGNFLNNIFATFQILRWKSHSYCCSRNMCIPNRFFPELLIRTYFSPDASQNKPCNFRQISLTIYNPNPELAHSSVKRFPLAGVNACEIPGFIEHRIASSSLWI